MRPQRDHEKRKLTILLLSGNLLFYKELSLFSFGVSHWRTRLYTLKTFLKRLTSVAFGNPSGNRLFGGLWQSSGVFVLPMYLPLARFCITFTDVFVA